MADFKREQRIEAAERNAYLVRGTELAAIRDDQSWAVRYQEYSTWEQYCEGRWELSRAHADYLINAALFVKRLQCNYSCALLPVRETHIRPLLQRLKSDDDRIAVWRDVLSTTKGTKIRASDVESARTAWQAPARAGRRPACRRGGGRLPTRARESRIPTVRRASSAPWTRRCSPRCAPTPTRVSSAPTRTRRRRCGRCWLRNGGGRCRTARSVTRPAYIIRPLEKSENP